jgi:uncharacterized membrane protein YfhO
VFKDYLLLKKLYIFKDIGSDTYNQAYPFYVHMSNYFRSDGIPRWSFNVGMGQNTFPGIFSDPFTLIISLFRPGQIPFVIVYIELLKIFLSGIFFFLYLRIMKMNSYVAIIGGLSFAFSGYMITGTEWYNFSTYCVYMAFALFAFEKYLMQNNWKFLPPAIYFLSTFPFSFYAFGLFLLCYVPLRYITQYNFRFRPFAGFMIKLTLICFIGLIISFFIWGNTLINTINSPRIGGEAGYFNLLKQTPVFFISEKLHYMTAILKLYSNDLFGSGSQFRGWYNYLEAPIFYSGILGLLTIPQLFVNSSRKEKIFSGIILLIWMLVVIFPFFRHTLNLYTGDYYKVSISFIITLLILYFALRSLNKIIENRNINLPVLFFSSAVLIFLLFYQWFPNSQKLIDRELRSLIVVLLAIYTLMLWLIAATRFRLMILVLMILLISFELGYNAWLSTNKRMVLTAREFSSKTGYNDYTVEALKFIRSNDNGFYRINKNYFSGNSIHTTLNEAHIQDFYGTSSYMSFNNLSYINFLSSTEIINPKNEGSTRWAIGLLTRPLLQTMASTKYQLSKAGGFDYTAFGYQFAGSFGDVSVLKNQFFLPLGFTYDKYMTQTQFSSLPAFLKDLTLLKAVVLNDKELNQFNGLSQVNLTSDSILQYLYDFSEYGLDIQNRNQGSLKISMHSQNNIKGDVEFDKRKLLFFSIPFDKGWNATIDGNKAELLQANIGFMGMMIDPGKHHVELSYTPPFLRISLIISLTGLIIYLGLLFLKKSTA